MRLNKLHSLTPGFKSCIIGCEPRRYALRFRKVNARDVQFCQVICSLPGLPLFSNHEWHPWSRRSLGLPPKPSHGPRRKRIAESWSCLAWIFFQILVGKFLAVLFTAPKFAFWPSAVKAGRLRVLRRSTRKALEDAQSLAQEGYVWETKVHSGIWICSKKAVS